MSEKVYELTPGKETELPTVPGCIVRYVGGDLHYSGPVRGFLPIQRPVTRQLIRKEIELEDKGGKKHTLHVTLKEVDTLILTHHI